MRNLTYLPSSLLTRSSSAFRRVVSVRAARMRRAIIFPSGWLSMPCWPRSSSSASVMSSAIAVLLLVVAPTASAAVDAETQANFDRAAAYWNASPNCPLGVDLRYDQAAVGNNNARVAWCAIFVGDLYAAETPAARCQTIVHEWGHLTGHGHIAGLPDDPVGVMVSYALPPACAALETTVEVAEPPVTEVARDDVAAAAWAAFDAAYVLRAAQKAARSNCTVEANELRARVARVKARRRCVKRYGIIRAEPPRPTMPRPKGLRESVAPESVPEAVQVGVE